MRQILEGAHLVLAQGPLAADQQQRAFGPEGIGDTGNRISRAGPSGDHCTPWRASDARVPIGRMRCHLFVTHIDNLDPAVADIPIVRQALLNTRLDAVMSNSFGFGGTNAALIFKKVP